MASLLGTAGIVSQLSDRGYLEKCRGFLFAEFSTFGLAGAPGLSYPDSKALLEKTPGFYTDLLHLRMDVEYGGADEFLRIHFGGVCPYDASIKRNLDYLNAVLACQLLASVSFALREDDAAPGISEHTGHVPGGRMNYCC